MMMAKMWRLGWWPALVLVALGALVCVRNVGAGATFGLPVTWSDEGPKYICLGSVAVRLGKDDTPVSVPERFEWGVHHSPEAEAARRCRVSAVPTLPGADVIASLTWPDSGYAVVVQRVSWSSREAMGRFKVELAKTRWAETGGSRRATRENPSFPGAAHEREGAWIQTVAVDEPGKHGVLLVTSGQFAREYF